MSMSFDREHEKMLAEARKANEDAKAALKASREALQQSQSDAAKSKEVMSGKKPIVKINGAKLFERFAILFGMVLVSMLYAFILRFVLAGFHVYADYWVCVGALYLIQWIKPRVEEVTIKA